MVVCLSCLSCFYCVLFYYLRWERSDCIRRILHAGKGGGGRRKNVERRKEKEKKKAGHADMQLSGVAVVVNYIYVQHNNLEGFTIWQPNVLL